MFEESRIEIVQRGEGDWAIYMAGEYRGTVSPKRQNITVRVFDGEQYDGDWPTPGYPALLVDAISWFQSKLEEIPAQYRETAQCEIDSRSGYEDSHYGHIEISYSRPETDEEIALRIARDEQRKLVVREKEIVALRALRTRYPDA